MESSQREFLAAVEAQLAAGRERAGDDLACRPGCDECCIGPFPINGLDARRLQEGLSRLRRSDPVVHARIEERTQRAVMALMPYYPADPADGSVDPEDPRVEALMQRFSGLACPALDPTTRTCDLYDYRPVTCRTYGLPTRVGARDLPPCRLCFQGANAEAVERCRVTVDPTDLEGQLLDDIDGRGGTRETFVAFALMGVLGEPLVQSLNQSGRGTGRGTGKEGPSDLSDGP